MNDAIELLEDKETDLILDYQIARRTSDLEEQERLEGVLEGVRFCIDYLMEKERQ